MGAGVGAIFNGSGRTYYILEHKTSSKYHTAGESQKIIIDQIEIGRDASCQVRFDESFETVSRKHCAIVRDGQNWQLIHLSSANPTLVNGRPVQGNYYLQSGDEIQLSVGGPRLGFIVPQGKQSLTSSIKFTERMSLFHQQALRPYRRAVWALSALLLLAIVGFGAWNYKLSLDNQTLQKQMMAYQEQLDSLAQVKTQLEGEEAALQQQVLADPTNEAAKAQLAAVQQNLQSVNSQYVATQQNYRSVKQKAIDYGFDDETDEVDEVKSSESAPASTNDVEEVEEDNIEAEEAPAAPSAATDVRDYYNDIYTLKIRRITIEKDGKSWDPGIALSSAVCGTGFIMNGAFLTARSNIEPWVFFGVYDDQPWRRELAEYVAAGCNVILDFEAYSTMGASHPLRFSNKQFNINSSGDRLEVVEIRKEIRHRFELEGIRFEYKKSARETYTVPVYTAQSRTYAKLAGIRSGGIPINAAASTTLAGGKEVTVAGYSGNTNIHNLASSIKYFTSNLSRVAGNDISLQSANKNWGFVGSPAFYQETDGSLRVIGVMVGNFGSEDHIIPIAACQ